MPLDVEIFGQGIYSPRQAARLIGGTPQEVLRWTRGSGPTQPLWRGHYQNLDDAREISFADLIEVRLVRAARQKGVSLQAIRFAIEFAKEKYSTDHPFSTIGFKTDGHEILMEATERDGQLVSLARRNAGQKVFTKIIEQSLSDLEYEGSRVSLWRPKSANHVVIDPNRAFGSPILDEHGISTSVLFDEEANGASLKYLASIYEIPKSKVEDAVKFEKGLAKQQAEIYGQRSI